MSRAELIYPLRRNMERELRKVEADPHNSEILTRYYKVRSTEVKLATLLENFIRLNIISRMLGKRFEDATVQDIEDLVFRIDQKPNKPKTLNKFRQALKQLFTWMKGRPKGDYPPEVRWIELKKVPFVAVTADDLLPYDECIRISEFATSARDKALLQCKLDAGCRIGEILTVKVSEVRFNGNGAVLYSEGKTGYQPIILTWSASTLAQWLNSHPFKDDKDAPLFCLIHSSRPKQMSYANARKVFKQCAAKAGHSRRVWLHLLKHVSSTEDAAKGLPDALTKYKHHWSPNSKMKPVYEHLSRSVIPEIQKETWSKVVGQAPKQPEKQERPLQTVKACRRCRLDNPRDSAYCNRCGFGLDYAAVGRETAADARTEELLTELAKDPERLAKLLELASHNDTSR